MSNGFMGTRPIVGARIANIVKFYPGFMKADGATKVQDRAVVPIVVNLRGALDEATGLRRPKPGENLTVTFWGNSAHNVCKSGAPGKEFKYLEVRSENYQGNVYDGDVMVIAKATGQPLLTKKTGLVAGAYIWGDDSAKRVNFEIGDGSRPHGFDGKIHMASLLAINASGGAQGVVDYLNAHANDVEAWKGMIGQRNAITYQPGMAKYGFADVVAPATGGYAPVAPTAPGPQAPTYQAPVAPAPAGPVEPKVDGYTKAQYLAANWTEIALRSDPKYAPLFVVNTVPAPAAVADPLAPVAPVAPGVPAPAAFNAQRAI